MNLDLTEEETAALLKDLVVQIIRLIPGSEGGSRP